MARLASPVLWICCLRNDCERSYGVCTDNSVLGVRHDSNVWVMCIGRGAVGSREMSRNLKVLGGWSSAPLFHLLSLGLHREGLFQT